MFELGKIYDISKFQLKLAKNEYEMTFNSSTVVEEYMDMDMEENLFASLPEPDFTFNSELESLISNYGEEEDEKNIHVAGPSNLKTYEGRPNRIQALQLEIKKLRAENFELKKEKEKLEVIPSSQEYQIQTSNKCTSTTTEEKEKVEVVSKIAKNTKDLNNPTTINIRNDTHHIGEEVDKIRKDSLARVIPKKFKFQIVKESINFHKNSQSRVMVFSQQKNILMISQKSSMPQLFNGFGVRFLDLNKHQQTQYIHMGTKSPRDIALNSSEQYVVAATQESSCKMFDSTSTFNITMFKPTHNVNIWSCTFDKERENLLYLGIQNGLGFTYDIRKPSEYVETFAAVNDRLAIISICSLKYSNSFPLGGILVCRLKSLWFYEYVNSAKLNTGTQLNSISGSFVSMHYCDKTNKVLLYARQNELPAKFFLFELTKVDEVVFLKVSFLNFLDPQILTTQISNTCRISVLSMDLEIQAS